MAEIPAGVPADAQASYSVTTAGGKSVSSQIDITPPHTYRVTTDNASDRYPCWGPGANYIYFCSTRSGGANWDLYRIPAQGGQAQRLTQYEGPNCSKIVFGAHRWSNFDIYVYVVP